MCSLSLSWRKTKERLENSYRYHLSEVSSISFSTNHNEQVLHIMQKMWWCNQQVQQAWQPSTWEYGLKGYSGRCGIKSIKMFSLAFMAVSIKDNISTVKSSLGPAGVTICFTAPNICKHRTLSHRTDLQCLLQNPSGPAGVSAQLQQQPSQLDGVESVQHGLLFGFGHSLLQQSLRLVQSARSSL